jgi:hypothetical protein
VLQVLRIHLWVRYADSVTVSFLNDDLEPIENEVGIPKANNMYILLDIMFEQTFDININIFCYIKSKTYYTSISGVLVVGLLEQCS